MSGYKGACILVPWHLGDVRDLTLRAVETVRRVRVLITEDPVAARSELESVLGVDCRAKTFLTIPERENPEWFARLLPVLREEDVALGCSGGTPCFIDPGSWIVAGLRRLGVSISALPGASILTTMIALSGVDWLGRDNVATFAVYLPGGPHRKVNQPLFEAVARADEHIFIFIPTGGIKDCVRAIAPVLKGRAVSVYFDLTKRPRERYPYADRVITMDCRQWLREFARMPEGVFSEASLLVHPRERRSRARRA